MEHMFQKQNSLDFEVVLVLLEGGNHLRGLSKAVGAPASTVKRSVDRLVEDNILDARRSGKNRVFSLRQTIEARTCILAAENYKALKCLRRYPHLAPVMERALEDCGGMVILFGSHTGFSAKKGSDIDIYCERLDGEIKGASVKTGKFDLTSPLVREIINNHAIFRGAEEFYERLGTFKEGG
ncbi:MAG: hypothetical protein JXB14_02170 [Candidatus Altiarchaeota archaeon]|nr:hypothetical protein [Candidatus Altiarchaeota archaeon]